MKSWIACSGISRRRPLNTDRSCPEPINSKIVERLTLALGASHRDSGYVAVNEIGEPYSPDTLTRMWLKMAKAAGVRPIRLHDARHSCGTALHPRGVPLAVIAKWLGHADASVTAPIYAHSQDDALKAAAQSLGGVVTSS
jgi:integrase